jgi:hypothetical protein
VTLNVSPSTVTIVLPSGVAATPYPRCSRAGIEFAVATVTAFRVSGVAVDQSGRPSPGAIVTLIPNIRSSASFMPTMAIADDDGAFEIGQVIPGTYSLNAHANEGGSGGAFGAVSFGVASDGTPSGTDTITVGAADIRGLRVVASRR